MKTLSGLVCSLWVERAKKDSQKQHGQVDLDDCDVTKHTVRKTSRCTFYIHVQEVLRQNIPLRAAVRVRTQNLTVNRTAQPWMMR